MEKKNYLSTMETDDLLDKFDETIEPTEVTEISKDWGSKTIKRQHIREELNDRGLELKEST